MAATDNSKFLSKTQYEVTLQRLAQVTGRSLGADSNNAFKADLSSSDRVLGSWTHPTATALTLTTANQVIKTLTVDAYGHVTAATQGALAAADIPSLAASKITSGTFGVARGGTGLSTIAAFSILYASAKDTLTTLAPNTTSTKKFLRMTGTGSAGAAPAWDTIAPGDLPSLYIGTTAVSPTSGAVTNLAGVTTFTPASGHTLSYSATEQRWKISDGLYTYNGIEVGDILQVAAETYLTSLVYLVPQSAVTSSTPYLYWDSTNSAWHLTGNFIADGYVSAGGLSTAGGGGGGGTSSLYVVDTWNDVDISDGDQVLGSVLGANINNRLTTLEGKATAVSFTQTLTSGKQIGAITIDGTSTNLYAPNTYALSDITGADDLQAIEALTGTSGVLQKTAANTWSLVSKTDSSSASAISTGTGLVTERDVYYGLPKINNGHAYTSSSSYYAPTTGGTSGYILKANGSTSAPTWATVDSLMGDYAKTTAVTQAIADAIAGVTSFEYSVVASLPTTGVKGTIYLIAHSHGTQDIYDEYIWIGDKYEKIGNTDIDLSGYWATTDLIAITATENTTLLNSYFPVS